MLGLNIGLLGFGRPLAAWAVQEDLAFAMALTWHRCLASSIEMIIAGDQSRWLFELCAGGGVNVLTTHAGRAFRVHQCTAVDRTQISPTREPKMNCSPNRLRMA